MTDEKRSQAWQKLLPFLITASCFAYLYVQLDRAAAAEGSGLISYLVRSFENVSWSRWLALMIPYCFFFFPDRQSRRLAGHQLVQRQDQLR